MQFSINVNDETGRLLEKKASEKGLSISVFLMNVIKQIIAPEIEDKVHHDLDELAGTWSDQEAAEFMDSVSEFGKIDRELWK